MQAVFRGAYCLRFCSLLQRKDTREIVRLASKALAVVALDIFVKNGWRSNNRLNLLLISSYRLRIIPILFVISLWTENIVGTWLCAVAEAGFLSFSKKTLAIYSRSTRCFIQIVLFLVHAWGTHSLLLLLLLQKKVSNRVDILEGPRGHAHKGQSMSKAQEGVPIKCTSVGWNNARVPS